MNIRLFKTHYHKVRKVYDKLLLKEPLTLNFESNRDIVKTSLNGSDKPTLILLAVLMRRFLHEKDLIYYKTVWNWMVSEYKPLLGLEVRNNINTLIKKAKNGGVNIEFDKKSLTAESIYLLKADADFFGLNNADAVKSLSSVTNNLGSPLVEFTF